MKSSTSIAIFSVAFLFFFKSDALKKNHQHHHTPDNKTTGYSKVIVVVGQDGSSETSDVEVIDLISTETTCQKPPNFPIATYKASGGLDFDEKPLVCGGSPFLASCHVYDNGEWKASHSLNEGRREFAMTASPFSDGKLFLSGGFESGYHRISSTELLTERGWQVSVPVPSTIAYHCMVALNSTSVMVIGGWQSDLISVGTYIFNSDSNVWSKGPSMGLAKEDHSCGLIRQSKESQDMTAIVVGGREEYSSLISSVEILDPTLNKWRNGPDLPLEVCCGALVQDPSGGAVLLGGVSNAGRLDTLYRLPHAGPDAAWEEMQQKLEKARMHHTAFLVPDNVAACN